MTIDLCDHPLTCRESCASCSRDDVAERHAAAVGDAHARLRALVASEARLRAALAGLLAMCGGLDTPTVRRAREALES